MGVVNMKQEHVSIDSTVWLLNSLVKIDPEMMDKLFGCRVDCNEIIARHPTVQVDEYSPGKYTVGMLGILNGLFGTNEEGHGLITSIKQDGVLIGFRRTDAK